ncbi:MAG TPA: hypothetical protein VFC19_08520 [Candidatus Limnocylindrales bacterium]|nr:hypothetical protein [Candidatus Limnocylindrales bacterium]
MSDVINPPRQGGIPEQPKWTMSWCPRWASFDVPRLWDMVEPEAKWSAYEQINGFMVLADLLLQHHILWQGRRGLIAQAWQSPAAEQFLLRLDVYGNDMLIDSECARQTAHALNSTVTALSKAREQIAPLVSQWNTVTKDWIPEWWDNAAGELNNEARKIMVEADQAIAAARPSFSAPGVLPSPTGSTDPGGGPIDPGGPGGSQGASGASSSTSSWRVPPVPGHEPLVGGPSSLLATSGAPRLVSAVPGQPVSMLPIAPGSPYAPFGGAYILPGPGVGAGGYVVPMPRSPGVVGQQPMVPRALTTPMTTGGGGASTMQPGGMMPVPMSGSGPSGGSHGALYRRPNVAWQAGKGVPPIIRVEEGDFVPDQPSPKQEEEFRDWFTELAYPWRAEFKTGGGAQVTIRTVAQ